MKIDPVTHQVTYSDPAKTKAFGDKLAEAMVKGLNKKVLEEQANVKKAKDKKLKKNYWRSIVNALWRGK